MSVGAILGDQKPLQTEPARSEAGRGPAKRAQVPERPPQVHSRQPGAARDAAAMLRALGPALRSRVSGSARLRSRRRRRRPLCFL